jgi:hypothetical protein
VILGFKERKGKERIRKGEEEKANSNRKEYSTTTVPENSWL